MAYVAAGRYDGFFQYDLNLWDIAAGIVLIKEAGGVLNEINLSINEKEKQTFQLFPNPSSGVISINANFSNPVSINVYTIHSYSFI